MIQFYARNKNNELVFLHNGSDEATEDENVRICDDKAREASKSHGPITAFLYKEDGELMYFVSKYFFTWPNFLDREQRYAQAARPKRR
jgi:hypothetical protein